MKTFYVTTPIYYANSEPHLGHLYTTLIADCLSCYKRQRGFESFFLTGSDEHGVNIERAAAARGIAVNQHVDQIVEKFKTEFARFGVHYDRWVRTTDAYHEAGVQNLWRLLNSRGHIYKDRYEGWFCGYCNEFKEVEEGAEHPPLCPIHERPLDLVAEESYFFKLSAFEQPLLQLYEKRPDFIRPETRRNEVVSFVAGGLKDLSISRVSVKWGIPVPDDPGHTIYVWLDALSNYITALGWGNDQYTDFERFWPALHLVGKDILRFHAVYWPAFLLAAGLEVPHTVYAHGMWLSGGRRMSKTLGNGIEPDVLYQHFTPEMVRYFILREMTFGQDGDFTYEALINRVNADLASGLGNLASRTLTMIERYANGAVPSPSIVEENYGVAREAGFDPEEDEYVARIVARRDEFVERFDEYAFSRALEAAWSVIAQTDKLISDLKPWNLAKDPQHTQTLNAVLYRAAEALRWLAVMLYPAMPQAAQVIWRQLGQHQDLAATDPTTLAWGGLKEGTPIGTIEPIFPRIDKTKKMAEIEKEMRQESATATEAVAGGAAAAAGTSPQPADVHASAEASAGGGGGVAAPPVAAAAPENGAAASENVINLIGIDDFTKVELRVGEILTAERVPKSDKLLRFTVDVGESAPRQILAGIAEHYEPEQLIHRKIVVVANLQPRRLRGFESQGMVLAASVGESGRPVLATFAEEVPNGTRLK